MRRIARPAVAALAAVLLASPALAAEAWRVVGGDSRLAFVAPARRLLNQPTEHLHQPETALS
ncbi:MAG: hypothetical protein R6V44_09450, partial [Paracoccaceae bacterium]